MLSLSLQCQRRYGNTLNGLAKAIVDHSVQYSDILSVLKDMLSSTVSVLDANCSSFF